MSGGPVGESQDYSVITGACFLIEAPSELWIDAGAGCARCPDVWARFFDRRVMTLPKLPELLIIRRFDESRYLGIHALGPWGSASTPAPPPHPFPAQAAPATAASKTAALYMSHASPAECLVAPKSSQFHAQPAVCSHRWASQPPMAIASAPRHVFGS